MKYEPLIADRYYHIYNRGNNGEDIFKEEKNYNYFLLLLKKHLLPTASIFCYCLLKNHFHLLIKTKDINNNLSISQGLSNLFNAYAKAINKASNRNGSLFKDRFQRKKIESEDYLITLILYIHLNPEHHNFTDDFSTYKHSSFQSIISEKPTLLQRKEVLNLFHDKENFKDVHYSRKAEILDQKAEIFIE
ncbi:transposase [Zunongwangia sp. F260]|uniref:Transposase n=1 Tax=Autumnicola lenta TaxID=3075593 RepID=A0ABU3CK36_9FLAO|nr:transposase [Zunongwangia sp. F260]MDT0646717.1 transposase [Zunongwangia sp. F260]